MRKVRIAKARYACTEATNKEDGAHAATTSDRIAAIIFTQDANTIPDTLVLPAPTLFASTGGTGRRVARRSVASTSSFPETDKAFCGEDRIATTDMRVTTACPRTTSSTLSPHGRSTTAAITLSEATSGKAW